MLFGFTHGGNDQHHGRHQEGQHLVKGAGHVEDEAWYDADERFQKFLREALKSGKNFCLIDCGTGFNTPMIIRFPFEKMVREHGQCAMVRLNLNEAVVQESCEEREVGINADMAKSIPDILKTMNL